MGLRTAPAVGCGNALLHLPSREADVKRAADGVQLRRRCIPSLRRSRSQAPGAAPCQPRAGPGSIDHVSPLRRKSRTPRNARRCSGALLGGISQPG